MDRGAGGDEIMDGEIMADLIPPYGIERTPTGYRLGAHEVTADVAYRVWMKAAPTKGWWNTVLELLTAEA